MNILAIDPGEKHCGVAWKKTITFGSSEVEPDYLLSILERWKLDVVVIEKYTIYPWQAKMHIFSKLETVKLIGKIEYICQKRKIKFIEQPTISKNYAQRSKREKLKKVKGIHAKDAYAHLLYFLNSNLARPKMKTKVQMEEPKGGLRRR